MLARFVLLPLLLASAHTAAAADLADAAERFVIGQGQEAVLRELTGFGAGPIGGCRADSVAIERVVLKVGFDCGGAARASVELHHPGARPDAAAKTEKFALVAGKDGAPAPLLSAFAARVRTLEAGFRWSQVEAPKGNQRPAAAPPPVALPAPGVVGSPLGKDGGGAVVLPPPATPLGPIDEAAEYARGADELARARYEEAVIVFQRLADLPTRPKGAVAMLLASLEALLPDDLRLGMLAARAAAAPNDALAQLLAGAAAHYGAHHRDSGPARDALLASAREALGRARAVFPPSEPAERPERARAIVEHLDAVLAGSAPPDGCRGGTSTGAAAGAPPPPPPRAEPGIGRRAFLALSGGAALCALLVAWALRRRAAARGRGGVGVAR